MLMSLGAPILMVKTVYIELTEPPAYFTLKHRVSEKLMEPLVAYHTSPEFWISPCDYLVMYL